VPQKSADRITKESSNPTIEDISKGFRINMFIHSSKDIDSTLVSISGQMDKEMWCMHIHNGILFHLKKKDILSFETRWIHIMEEIILSETSQKQKEKYHMSLCICRI
jgi:hypothetical protein